MKRSILTVLSLILVYTLFSQEDSLLKNFKFRNIHYRAIVLNAGGGSVFNDVDYPSGLNSNRGLSGSLSGSYYTVKSTDRILFNMTAGIASGFSTNKSDRRSVFPK